MSDALPAGWATAPLDKLCRRIRGVSYARDDASAEPKPGSLPILRANNIESDRLQFKDLVYVPTSRISEAQRIRKGDVVIAMSSGSKSVVGKTAQALTEWDGAFGAFCGVLRPSPELNSRYLGLFLRTRDYRRRISDLAAGTNINNLKAEHFSEIEVPLAPLAEQLRIVAKLKMLLGKVDDCQRRLAKIPRLLKRFRQSVLAAACSGRLTADWREENSIVQTPEHRLASISKINAGKPKREIERAKKLKAEEWFFDIAAELPESWLQVNFMDVTWLITCGVAKRPNYVEKGVPFLSAQNAKPFKANLNEIRFIAEQDFKTFTVGGKPEKNDILYSRVGAKFGEAARIPFDFDFAIYVSLTLIKPIHELIEADFLVAYLNSYHGLIQAHGGVLGSGIQNLNVENVRKFRVPLPPLAEQHEIVRRVEQLFTFADQLEARFAKAQAHVDKLTQSLLAKAFRGELAPQDPNDEPASALLARLRSETNGEEKPTRRKVRA